MLRQQNNVSFINIVVITWDSRKRENAVAGWRGKSTEKVSPAAYARGTEIATRMEDVANPYTLIVMTFNW